jgi:serine/threonine protein phosphatase 1
MSVLTTVDVMPRRLIIFGDIHGCFDELSEMLERLAPEDDDLVIAAGDLVRKGPDAHACLTLWRERGYLAVRGNNEERLLRYARMPLRWVVPAHDRKVLDDRELLAYVRSWPQAILVAPANVGIVHGGVLPDSRFDGSSLERQPETLPRLRYVRAVSDGWMYVPKGQERSGDMLWADVWRGDTLVVYGHTPLREPKRSEAAIGIDTGCVYGGALTAAVLERGEWRFEQVPAHRSRGYMQS